jgi:hypothetical protein
MFSRPAVNRIDYFEVYGDHPSITGGMLSEALMHKRTRKAKVNPKQ